ncbi:MAG: 30S ribosomal protein S12 [Candidatus Aenigmarchaeota archaeon]|nr:30S ribosomal protein S12 [Candidatus Aenigmarchaeota archaeon]
MAGNFAARKLKKNRKKFKLKKEIFRDRIFHFQDKMDPMEGAPQAKGIVLEKRQMEQKQPSSGMIKCVRIRLVKNGKQITAHVPKTAAINQITEHDQVTVEGIGGSQGGPVGSIPGVKWRVFKVNGISLEMLRLGKKQKPAR